MAEPVYPKPRIDALTDGLFAVAMTILVLDVRVPEGIQADSAGLVQALKDLWPRLFPYALSFYILGSIWLANIRLGSKSESVSSRYVSWWLLYLLLATCLPFSTALVGRFAQLAPAVWVYSLNMAALAAVGYRLVVLLAKDSDEEYVYGRKIALTVLMLTSVACLALSTISPRKALWVYAFSVAEPKLARWMGAAARRHNRPP